MVISDAFYAVAEGYYRRGARGGGQLKEPSAYGVLCIEMPRGEETYSAIGRIAEIVVPELTGKVSIGSRGDRFFN